MFLIKPFYKGSGYERYNREKLDFLGGKGRDKRYVCNGCGKACTRKSSAHPQRCIEEPEEVEDSTKGE